MNRYSRCTVTIPPSLHRRLKLRAASECRPLANLIEDLLTQAMGSWEVSLAKGEAEVRSRAVIPSAPAWGEAAPVSWAGTLSANSSSAEPPSEPFRTKS